MQVSCGDITTRYYSAMVLEGMQRKEETRVLAGASCCTL